MFTTDEIKEIIEQLTELSNVRSGQNLVLVLHQLEELLQMKIYQSEKGLM